MNLFIYAYYNRGTVIYFNWKWTNGGYIIHVHVCVCSYEKNKHTVNTLVMLTENMEGSKWQKAKNCKLFRLPTIHFQIKFYLSVKLITDTVMWIQTKGHYNAIAKP